MEPRSEICGLVGRAGSPVGISWYLVAHEPERNLKYFTLMLKRLMYLSIQKYVDGEKSGGPRSPIVCEGTLRIGKHRNAIYNHLKCLL